MFLLSRSGRADHQGPRSAAVTSGPSPLAATADAADDARGGHTTMDELDDIWEFLPVEDEVEPLEPVSPEEAALHVGAPAEWGRTFDDPARRAVATGEEEPIALALADDEDDGLAHRDTEHEFDVEELLERQHYAFAPATEERSW
jgi:hypothetical protein